MAKLPAMQYVRRGLTEGLSANAALRSFQQAAHDQGLQALRRQDFLRLYSATRAARARTAAAMAADRTSPPGQEIINEKPNSATEGYGSWVMVYQRQTGGTEPFQQPWLLKSEELLTPEEAERRVGELIAQNPYDYGRTVTGVQYIGTDHYTPGVG